MLNRTRERTFSILDKFYQKRIKNITRNLLGELYLKGTGLEIGALYKPMPVNKKKAKVLYVDRMHVAELRKQYPELKQFNLVDVDIISNGENLDGITDATQDFIIANHFIEHCKDPILTIKNMLRTLKPGGIIFMAVPDKRFTFDKLRTATSIEHLLNDYNKGGDVSKTDHFYEWVKWVNQVDEENIEKGVNDLIEMDYSIHFHVWEKKDFDKFLSFLNTQMNFEFETEVSLRVQGTNENIYILKKLSN